MKWYYAVGQQQQGPLDDAQLDALLAAGTVTPDTLIWREGQANWQPLRAARTTRQISTPISRDAQVKCAECAKLFDHESTFHYRTLHVCTVCKPAFVQNLKNCSYATSIRKPTRPLAVRFLVSSWKAIVGYFRSWLWSFVALVVWCIPAVLLQFFFGFSNEMLGWGSGIIILICTIVGITKGWMKGWAMTGSKPPDPTIECPECWSHDRELTNTTTETRYYTENNTDTQRTTHYSSKGEETGYSETIIELPSTTTPYKVTIRFFRCANCGHEFTTGG